MPIKSERTTTPAPPAKSYPYLGVYESGTSFYQIVLFISLNTGMLVGTSSSELKATDMYYATWPEELYSPYTGSVTLSNG